MAPATPGAAWVALAALLLAGAAFGAWSLPAPALDWQPGRWAAEPWRWWSAAFVHLSPIHLVGNLAGTALVAALGWRAALPGRAAVAWATAWPLTHLGLLAMPALRHYGGLSGVLHAAVAVLAVELVATGPRRSRFAGCVLLAALAGKVLSEAPWRSAVVASPHWDIPIAPIAHASGALAGLACGVLAVLLTRGGRRG